MKKLLACLLFFLLLETTPADARLVVHSPEGMIENAQFIVAGEVIAIRDGEVPDFVVDVVRVYKGQVGTARLVIPQPYQPGTSAIELLAPPPVGTQILLFISVSEAGRFVPASDLNWIGILEDGLIKSLYMGAAAHEWREEDYINAYNAFLAENPGTEISPPPQNGEEETSNEPRPHGVVNPAIFFFMAGVALVLLVISAKLKKVEH